MFGSNFGFVCVCVCVCVCVLVCVCALTVQSIGAYNQAKGIDERQ